MIQTLKYRVHLYRLKSFSFIKKLNYQLAIKSLLLHLVIIFYYVNLFVKDNF